ncbi:MAG: hypothetical protein ABI333_00340 [bacterium]
MIRRTLLVALVTGLFSGSAVGCVWGDPPGESENLPPVINGFLVDGELLTEVALRSSDRPSITVVTWDPNGDLLTNDLISWTTSDGSIVDVGGATITSGPSVRLRPPNIVWQNPPQEVFLTMTATVSDGVTEPVSGELTVQILPPCSPTNQPPTIIDVYADPVQIELGQSATIWVEAEDPDGDAMTYEWTPDFGYIEGSGATVTWVSTDTCCPDYYPIEVVVSDGCDASWDFVDVWIDV